MLGASEASGSQVIAEGLRQDCALCIFTRGKYFRDLRSFFEETVAVGKSLGVVVKEPLDQPCIGGLQLE